MVLRACSLLAAVAAAWFFVTLAATADAVEITIDYDQYLVKTRRRRG